MKVEDIARKTVEPFLIENNCLLWDVIFEKEGALHYLKVLFNKQDGSLDMEMCERLTPPINKLLDEQDFIKKGLVDIVEIGSPGISRRVRHKEHFDYCMGKQLSIMRRLDNGKTETVTGLLNGYSQDDKSITLDSEIISLKKCIRVILEEIQQ